MSESMKLPYKIREKYGSELADINYRLTNMENGKIYGYNGNNSRMDGSLQQNCSELRRQISELLLKIQNGTDSIDDEIGNAFFGVKESWIHNEI